MKKFLTIALTFVIGMSMTIMPAVAAENEVAVDTQPAAEETLTPDAGTAAEADVTAQEAEPAAVDEDVTETTESQEPEAKDINIDVSDGSALEGLDGLYISDIENDPELCYVLDDPTFYRY